MTTLSILILIYFKYESINKKIQHIIFRFEAICNDKYQILFILH